MEGQVKRKAEPRSGWLVLLFSLPTKHASHRVEIWRKLRGYGTLALQGGGHLLPRSAENQERFEWLAASIRGHKGEASIIDVGRIDNLPDERVAQLFREARGKDYQALLLDIQKAQKSGSARRKLAAFKRRLEEIANIDYFNSPVRGRAQTALAAVTEIPGQEQAIKLRAKREFANKGWVTRPRPGIDRISSAWLIANFIDPKPEFFFAKDAMEHPAAIPFDMFGEAGFGHQGEYCTFETLMKSFRVMDRHVQTIAEIVHDADLGDGKFGRMDGHTIEIVLAGWEQQGIPDEELLNRGMALMDGLYRGLRGRA